jgi:hypothetical protein
MIETDPPLPLQMCFEDLSGQLLRHLTRLVYIRDFPCVMISFFDRCYPALFGAHSTPLQKNGQFLSSSLDSMLRIMNASADGKRKQAADIAYQVPHTRSLVHQVLLNQFSSGLLIMRGLKRVKVYLWTKCGPRTEAMVKA